MASLSQQGKKKKKKKQRESGKKWDADKGDMSVLIRLTSAYFLPFSFQFYGTSSGKS